MAFGFHELGVANMWLCIIASDSFIRPGRFRRLHGFRTFFRKLSCAGCTYLRNWAGNHFYEKWQSELDDKQALTSDKPQPEVFDFEKIQADQAKKKQN
jgi:hypothetical protein